MDDKYRIELEVRKILGDIQLSKPPNEIYETMKLYNYIDLPSVIEMFHHLKRYHQERKKFYAFLKYYCDTLVSKEDKSKLNRFANSNKVCDRFIKLLFKPPEDPKYRFRRFSDSD